MGCEQQTTHDDNAIEVSLNANEAYVNDPFQETRFPYLVHSPSQSVCSTIHLSFPQSVTFSPSHTSKTCRYSFSLPFHRSLSKTFKR